MQVFGVERDESYDRFRENVDIVQKAWSCDRLTYEGRFNTYHDVEVLPKPLQDPMPTWIGASSQDAIDWAAGQGHAILMDPHSTPRRDRPQIRPLPAAALPPECDGRNRPTPMARLIAIAPTDAAAEAVAREGARWTVESYVGVRDGASKEERIRRYVEDVIIHGSPAKVVDQLKRLEEEIPLDYLLASILSHQTLLLLTDEVIPRM